MPGLRDSLAEYGEVMRRAIAGQWGVELEGAEDLPARLAEVMLEPERLRSFVEALEPEARSALAQVAAAGGRIRGHILTRAHGEVRRLGPRALEREQPWRHPQGGAERLWYAGLLFRRYGRLGAYHGELYYLPEDLLAALPPQPAPAIAITLEPVSGPDQVQDEADALALDLEALLAHLRRQPAPLPRGGHLPPTLAPTLRERWRGSPDPERLALLLRLALRSRLAVRRGERLEVGSRARAWLQQPPFRRQWLLFSTWRRDAHWNELWRVPSLRCEDAGWRNDPRVARSAVLEALHHCPEGWLRLGDLVAALKATRPDFARPDGDYDRWYIRSARTGQYLQGFAHWDDVEGALIAHLVTRSLHWLGAIALEPTGTLFRLTRLGRALLGQAAPPAAPRPAPLAIRQDLTIVVPRGASAYDRVRLERFARWEGRRGDDDLYRIEPERTWQALNEGIKARQIERFLRRASGRPLPGQVLRALGAWSTAFGQVTLRRAVLLQVADEETLRQLRSDPELGQRLGVEVSERAVLVAEDELPQVLARLKALGWWPRLVGLAGP